MKKHVFKIITKPILNIILRKIYGVLPSKYNKRFPYVGIFKWFFRDKKYIKMYSDGSDTIVSYLYWLNSYESSVINLWLDRIKDNSVILDIGANTGIYSLVAAKYKNVKVFSFEPTPRILNFLRKNVSINDLENKVFISDKAASNHIGETNFHVVKSVTIPTGSSENESFRKGMTEKINVSVTTIDTFLSENSIDYVHLVKIDTESTEPYVLEGMKNTLEKSKPDIICEILDQTTADKIQDILSPLGYYFYLIKDTSLELEKSLAPNLKYHNHFFSINKI